MQFQFNNPRRGPLSGLRAARGPRPPTVWCFPPLRRSPGCWPYPGRRKPGTYAKVRIKGQMLLAHRVAWEIASGAPIPPGMFVLHTCDNPECCRADDAGVYPCNGKLLPRFGHLALGTHADNQADMIAKGRAMHGARHPRRLRPALWANARLCGEAHGRAKLTEVDVRAIRARHERWVRGGVSIERLAAEYGVSRQLVSRITRHEIWTHI